MQNEVEKLVLQDNHDQNLALDILEYGKINFDSFGHLIEELEVKKLLNAKVEYLPDQNELSKRFNNKEYITRPELSVILSYSKMSVSMDLSDAHLIKDQYFNRYLMNYFPKIMQSDFKEEILNHPLKINIINTIVSNKIVNNLGPLRISELKRETGAKACDIIRAYFVISHILKYDQLIKQICNDQLYKLDANQRLYILDFLANILQRSISWIIRYAKHPIDINQYIENYSKIIDNLFNLYADYENMFEYDYLSELIKYKLDKYQEKNLPNQLIEKY